MRRLSLGKRLFFSACVSIGVWLGLEGLVTALYAPEIQAWSSPPPSPRKGVSVMQGHPYLIYEYLPGVHKDGGVTLTINSLGLRGPEITRPKPTGVRRFITTGDSSVFGFGVEDDEVFSSVAANSLGAPVEAVVGATPGYSTYQTLNLLRLRGLSTEPDLFVIGNLWSDNNFDAFVDKDTIATLSGYEQSATGAVVRMLTRSAIFRVADWKLRVRPQLEKVRVVDWQQSSEDRGQIGLRRVAINDYAANLDQLVQIAKSVDADVVFLLLSNNEDLSDGHNDNAPKAWTPYRDVMRDTAERYGAPVIDVPALFQESGLSKSELFLDKMHPTARGHHIIGDALASLLRERGWPEGASLWGGGSGAPLPEYVDPFLNGSESTAPSQAGPSPSTPNAPSAIRIEGTLVMDAFPAGGVVHLDVVTPGSMNPTVIQSIQVRSAGVFVLPIGQARTVVLRAYVDPEGDGPDADDPRYVFSEQPIEVGETPVTGIRIDLDAGTLSGG